MVKAPGVLVPGRGITLFFGWPLEKWFLLNFVQLLINKFFEHGVDPLRRGSRCRSQTLLRRGPVSFLVFFLWGQIISLVPCQLILHPRVLVDMGH